MKRVLLPLLLLAVTVQGAAAQDVTPTVRTTNPALAPGYREARVLSLEPMIALFGADPDATLNRPTHYRYLYKPAKIGLVYITTEYYFQQYMDQLVVWDDPLWSDWIPWEGVQPVLPHVAFAERDIHGDIAYYLLALQVMDADGAVSVQREYGYTVHNFRVSSLLRPTLTVRESVLGTFVSSGVNGNWSFDLAPGQPVDFTWLGTADPAAGELVGYRWGWDLADPEDPSDPGWAVPDYGLTGAYAGTGETSFPTGLHALTIECLATGMPVTRVVFHLSVVPIPDLMDRLPMLLVDDVGDHFSNGWPNADGTLHYDQDARRDARWLQLVGDAPGFDPVRDVVDLEGGTPFGFRDLVTYRAVIWSSRSHPASYVTTHFDDFGGYNWLENYQLHAGNVLLAGAGAVNNFARQKRLDGEAVLEWMHPIIYESTESDQTSWWGTLARSYGVTFTSPQTYVPTGTLSYGYKTLGLALISPFATDRIGGQEALHERKDRYSGLKGLELDPVFAAQHAAGGGLPSAVGTDVLIDWADDDVAWSDPVATGLELEKSYALSFNDEFYDVNVSWRTTPWAPQERPGGGPMIEPMWRAVSRYDWFLDSARAAGNTAFPTAEDLEIIGDEQAPFTATLTPGCDVRTVTEGVPVGFFTYATVETKPTGLADVVWGFDPTRFEPAAMSQALRWVLGQHFGLQLSAPAAEEVSR